MRFLEWHLGHLISDRIIQILNVFSLNAFPAMSSRRRPRRRQRPPRASPTAIPKRRCANNASNHILFSECVNIARKKNKLDEAVRRTAEILEAHMSALTPACAKALRKDLHLLAVKSYRNANRETSPV
jgi:hypothetical protein